MGSLYFEDVEVGDRCTAGPYLVTKNEIIQFAKQYDPVPENIDEEAAAGSIFGGLTACSPHTSESSCAIKGERRCWSASSPF